MEKVTRFEDLNMLPKETIEELRRDVDKTINQTFGFIRYLKNKSK